MLRNAELRNLIFQHGTLSTGAIVQIDIDSVYFQQDSLRNLLDMVGENWAFRCTSTKDAYNDAMRGTRISFDCTKMETKHRPLSGTTPVQGFRLDNLPSVKLFECFFPALPGYTGVIFLSLRHVTHLRESGIMTLSEMSIVCAVLNYSIDSLNRKGSFPRIFGCMPKFRIKSKTTITSQMCANTSTVMPYEAVLALGEQITATVNLFKAWSDETLLPVLKNLSVNGLKRRISEPEDPRGDDRILKDWKLFEKGVIWSFSVAGVKNHFKTKQLYSRTMEINNHSARQHLKVFVREKTRELKSWLMNELFPRYERNEETGTILVDALTNVPRCQLERNLKGQYFFDVGLDFLPSKATVDFFPILERLYPRYRKAIHEKKTQVSAYMEGVENTQIETTNNNNRAERMADAARNFNNSIQGVGGLAETRQGGGRGRSINENMVSDMVSQTNSLSTTEF